MGSFTGVAPSAAKRPALLRHSMPKLMTYFMAGDQEDEGQKATVNDGPQMGADGKRDESTLSQPSAELQECAGGAAQRA